MSAGGQFSCHLLLTLSDTFKGAGCAKGSAFGQWFGTVLEDLTPDEISERAIAELNGLNSQQLIDPLDNLSSEASETIDRAVIIISGQNDPTIPARN
jgi:hypothetical protein